MESSNSIGGMGGDGVWDPKQGGEGGDGGAPMLPIEAVGHFNLIEGEIDNADAACTS